ncbi:Maf family protein [Pseudobacteriovorax antillogorgiicola]|nr:nucleoside triphosphate pyrophosphatase [Pseudobacteriovorax antillogorgiicola]
MTKAWALAGTQEASQFELEDDRVYAAGSQHASGCRILMEPNMNINELILGSTSKYRAMVLGQAGIRHFRQLGSAADEEAIVHSQPLAMAQLRAEAKGNGVEAPPKSIVIAGDQVLEFEGKPYGKVATADEAKARLRLFSGKTHYLHSAYALVLVGSKGQKSMQSRVVSVPMTMRALSEAEVDAYVATDEWQGCAGCYQYENRGVHLFEKVLGDSTAIIGLPMPQILCDLRDMGVNLLIDPEGPW